MGYPSHGSCKRLTDRGVVRVWLRVWLRVWWQGSRLTYGLNYLDTTWDYNKVTGCVCDHDGSYNKSSTTYTGTSTGDILDYKGYDCSLREYQALHVARALHLTRSVFRHMPNGQRPSVVGCEAERNPEHHLHGIQRHVHGDIPPGNDRQHRFRRDSSSAGDGVGTVGHVRPCGWCRHQGRHG